MLRKIRSIVGNALNWKRIVWNEKSNFRVPFFKRLQYAIRGFSANEYIWYHFEENDYHEYISEFDRMRSRSINGAYRFILDDKLVFEEVFGKYANVPCNYAWIKDGKIYGLHKNGLCNENIISFLKADHKCVLKWNDRGGGTTHMLSLLMGAT